MNVYQRETLCPPLTLGGQEKGVMPSLTNECNHNGNPQRSLFHVLGDSCWRALLALSLGRKEKIPCSPSIVGLVPNFFFYPLEGLMQCWKFFMVVEKFQPDTSVVVGSRAPCLSLEDEIGSANVSMILVQLGHDSCLRFSKRTWIRESLVMTL